MRIVTLNLRHGGGVRGNRIVEYFASTDADVLVLTEFREGKTGLGIRLGLESAGYAHWASSGPPATTNGVAVASRRTFAQQLTPPAVGVDPWRWLDCDFDGCRLAGLYFPGSDPHVKVAYWEWFMPHAKRLAAHQRLLIGDFNTGKHRIDEVGATFAGPEYMDAMERAGWVDAWRSRNPDGREYTWMSSRGGEFRLDYAWLSPSASSWLRDVRHDHVPRVEGVTDHSALMVDLGFPSVDR